MSFHAGWTRLRTFFQGVFRLCSIESPNRDMRLLAKPSRWSPVMWPAHVVPLVSVASVPVVVMASAHGPTSAMIPLAMGIVTASPAPSESTARSNVSVSRSVVPTKARRVGSESNSGFHLPVITCCTHSHTTILPEGKVLLQVQSFIRHFSLRRECLGGN